MDVLGPIRQNSFSLSILAPYRSVMAKRIKVEDSWYRCSGAHGLRPASQSCMVIIPKHQVDLKLLTINSRPKHSRNRAQQWRRQAESSKPTFRPQVQGLLSQWYPGLSLRLCIVCYRFSHHFTTNIFTQHHHPRLSQPNSTRQTFNDFPLSLFPLVCLRMLKVYTVSSMDWFVSWRWDAMYTATVICKHITFIYHYSMCGTMIF